MNSPIKKRSNPFAKPLNTAAEEEKTVEVVEEKELEQKNEPVKVQKQEVVEEIQEENEVEEDFYEQPVKVVQKQQPKKQMRQSYIQPNNDSREKFTSTMDIQLRRRIKIVCATRGIMFSEFVEQACIEKLKKEA